MAEIVNKEPSSAMTTTCALPPVMTVSCPDSSRLFLIIFGPSELPEGT